MQVGDTQTIGMTTNGYYIGLPVTSHNTNYLCTPTFSNVLVGTNLSTGTGTSAPVSLSLKTSLAGGVAVQWPYCGNLNGVFLYDTPSLTPPVVWSVVTNSLVLASNQWTVTLPDNLSTNAVFYRLAPGN